MASCADPGGRWHIEHQHGSAHELHARSAALVGSGSAPPVRRARVLSVERPALVLGSGQPQSDVDGEAAARLGVEVAHRRSGGGAVLVDPGAVIWIDLIIPAGDPMWHVDVGRAAWWVGETWAAALEAVAGTRPQVWRGGMRRSPWSTRVCFAGLGPGEVCLDDRKVVGISQRRTRAAALLQTAALLRWDPAALLALLRVDDAERARGRSDLAAVAVGVGPERGGPLLDAFLAALP